MTDVLVQVEDLGKKYARSLRRSLGYGMRDLVDASIGRRRSEGLREDEFWALSGVSFEVNRGQCLAILGGNGAGKSTLLKLVAGVLRPDRGRVRVHGRIEKMIELMAGMSPSLTGRENVQLRARMLGLSAADSRRRIDEIVAFAEIEESVDTPVMYYSSGMKARLGFAATVVMAPDVLVVDEVLAVGDLGFRMRCYERVDQMRRTSAVLMVTHGMNHVSRMASAALVLHKGRQHLLGSPQAGIAAYQELVGGQAPAAAQSHRADLVEMRLFADGRPVDEGGSIAYGQRLSLEGVHRHPAPLSLSIVLHEGNGPTVGDWHSARAGFQALDGEWFRLDAGPAHLCPGHYRWVAVGLGDDGTQHFLGRPLRFKVEGLHLGSTRWQPDGEWTRIGVRESIAAPHEQERTIR